MFLLCPLLYCVVTPDSVITVPHPLRKGGRSQLCPSYIYSDTLGSIYNLTCKVHQSAPGSKVLVHVL